MSTDARPPAEEPRPEPPRSLLGLWVICVFYGVQGVVCAVSAFAATPPPIALLAAFAAINLGVASTLWLRLRVGWYAAMALATTAFVSGLPGSLAQLAPGYLDEVSVDPFTGEAFGYEPAGEEPRIWSVGPDQVPGEPREEGGDDIVVPLAFAETRARSGADR